MWLLHKGMFFLLSGEVPAQVENPSLSVGDPVLLLSSSMGGVEEILPVSLYAEDRQKVAVGQIGLELLNIPRSS